MAALVILIVIAALGAASMLGWTVDSRDPEFSLGRVLNPRRTPDSRPSKPARIAGPVISARELRP